VALLSRHPSMGKTRIASLRPTGSPHRLDLHLRRHLAEGRKRSRSHPAQMQHLCDDPPPCRDCAEYCTRRACRAPARPSRLAYERQAGRSPNVTIMPLHAKCPELNPQENVWQFLRDNPLSNRVFKSYDDIVDHCCDAWNSLVEQPWRIMSIGLREWAYRF
jgi:hypothetical protein